MRKTPAPPFPAAPFAVLVALAALVAACAQQTPEERVAELRSHYEAKLQNFVVKEKPLVDEMAAGDEMSEGEEAAAEADAGDEMAEGEEPMEEVPLQRNVLLDILIRHDNLENLPGITLEVAQLAEAFAASEPDQQPTWEEVAASPHLKRTWRIWVDTSTIARGQGNSVVHTLDDVEVEPGDRFTVAVRKPVPPEEYGDYREFAPGE